jgi:hypothetical protein
MTDAAQVWRGVTVDVGTSYLSATSTPRDPVVAVAYERLQAETDRLFDTVVRSEDPTAVRIVFTRSRDPYSTAAELIEAARTSRTLEITTAAAYPEPIHPLLGCEYGGPFDRFRAVHDLVGHAATGLGFGLVDEIAAWRVQERLHSRMARLALATELLAVNSARAIIGEPPEHKATILEPELLRRSTHQSASPSGSFDQRTSGPAVSGDFYRRDERATTQSWSQNPTRGGQSE